MGRRLTNLVERTIEEHVGRWRTEGVQYREKSERNQVGFSFIDRTRSIIDKTHRYALAAHDKAAK